MLDLFSPIPCPAVWFLAYAQRARSRTEAEGIPGIFAQELSQTDRARCLGETVRWLTHLQHDARRHPPGGRASGAPGVAHQTPEGSVSIRRDQYDQYDQLFTTKKKTP